MELLREGWNSPEGTAPLILVVDDSDDDTVLFQRAVQQLHYTGRIEYVQSRKEAIAYLAGTGEFADRERFSLPGFLILDLKMPDINGFDVFTWLRNHPIPLLHTVILTSSEDMRDINRANALGAVSFVSKVANFGEFKKTVNYLLTSFRTGHTQTEAADLLQV